MATSSGKKVIVFDLDGTLVEVGARDYAIYRDLLVEDGLTPLAFEPYWSLRRERTPLPDVLARSVDDAATYLAGFVARRDAVYEAPRYIELDRVLPTVPETLFRVRARYECVLITSRKDAAVTERQLVVLGLRSLLRAVHCCDGDKTVTLGTIADVALVVGDTEHDIRLGAHYGYPCFSVTTGIRSRGFLGEARPAYLADSLAELLDVL
jgi:phosphoglycolate phosphatase-like HAD superfamily hydrolase